MGGNGDGQANGLTEGSLIARNTVLNLGGLGLPLVVAVFTMPPIVAGLGPGRFGILALIWVVLGYGALLDLGLARATTKFAAEALATGDLDRIAASVRGALGMQLVVGVLAGIGLAAATPLLVERALNVPPELVGPARNSFYLLAGVAPVVVVTNTFRGLLEARQRFGLVNAVRLPVSLGNFLLPLAGVLLGWSLPWIVAGLLAGRVLLLVLFAVLAVRDYAGLWRPAKMEWEDLRALLGFGGWVTVSSLISPLLVYLDRFVVGAVLSVAAVGFYSAPHELVMRLAILPSSVVATLFPALSASAGAADRPRLEALVAGAVKFLVVAAGPVLVVLAVLAPELLELWLGGEYARRSGAALRILALGMLANTLAYVPGVLLQAVGRPDIPAKFHLVELPIHLALLWTFTQAWGITGAAAAWALRMALDGVLLGTASFRLKLVSRAALRARGVDRALVFLAFLAVAAAAVAVLVSASAAKLAGVGVVLALALVAAWSRVLHDDERERLLRLVRTRTP